jgi:hypothetical protein
MVGRRLLLGRAAAGYHVLMTIKLVFMLLHSVFGKYRN